MLVGEVNLQELIEDIQNLLDKKKIWENKKNSKNASEVRKNSNNIKKKYLKTSDKNIVIDLINTISNNNDIIDLKPSNLSEIINENKEEVNNLIKKGKIVLQDIIQDKIFQNILINDDNIIREYIKKNKLHLYSLLYEKNPNKYHDMLTFYSLYFSNNIDKEKYIYPLIEKAFLDDDIPEDWELCLDKETGNYYYYNEETDESQWENPSINLWKKYIEIEKKKYIEKGGEKRKDRKIINKKTKENESENLTVLLEIDDEEYSNYNLSDSSFSQSSSSNDSYSPNLRRSPRIRDLRKKRVYNQILGDSSRS